MNILILTGSNPFINAGIAAYDIYNSLSLKGHKVVLLTRYYDERFDNNMFSIYNKFESIFDSLYSRIQNKISKKIKTDSKFYMHSINYKKNFINSDRIISKIENKIDFILYAFPHHFLTDKNLFELNQHYKCPVLVMPADLAQITGGCHYCNDCTGYTAMCGNCPGLYSKNENDITRQIMLYKTNYVQKTNSVILCNNWQKEYILKSSLYVNKNKFCAHVVINENTFSPGNKKELRANHNIPLNCKLIFFGAAYLNDKRKGLSYLIDALNEINTELTETEKQNTALLIAGNVNDELLKNLPLRTYQLGHLNHNKLADAYRMADVFVSPSIMDAGPMMVAQAMMCGTPVVAFEMGNAKDYIINGKTGYICKIANPISLKEGIINILCLPDNARIEMSQNCRNQALSLSSYNSFATNMDNIFRTIKTNQK